MCSPAKSGGNIAWAAGRLISHWRSDPDWAGQKVDNLGPASYNMAVVFSGRSDRRKLIKCGAGGARDRQLYDLKSQLVLQRFFLMLTLPED